MDRMRVSASAFAQIMFDDDFLLVLNKAAREDGDRVYTPIGGALEYRGNPDDIFAEMNPCFERVAHDLRLTLPREQVPVFRDWFYTRQDRETSVARELYEELVEEEAVLHTLSESDVEETYLDTVIPRYTPPHRDQETQYFFEIYRVDLPRNYEERLEAVAAAPRSPLTLASWEEIRNRETSDGTIIGKNATFLS